MAFIELSYKSESLKRTVSLNIFLPYGDGGENAENHLRLCIFFRGLVRAGLKCARCLACVFSLRYRELQW